MADGQTVIIDYIKAAPQEQRAMLTAMYRVLHAAFPDAEERISYGMPTMMVAGKPVAYFGQHNQFMGFYPTSGPISAFANQLNGYKHSKGAVQLPLGEPLPAALITAMVQWRVAAIENGQGQAPRKARATVEMSADVQAALAEAALDDVYQRRPRYQRNDYLRWIDDAKRVSTRASRTAQMIAELRAGDVYMKRPWHPRG